MRIRISRLAWWLALTMVVFRTVSCPAQQIKILERPPDPHGSPRPARCRDVPVRTSLYFELDAQQRPKGGEVSPESISVSLQPQGGSPVLMLRPGGIFSEGCRGWLRRSKTCKAGKHSRSISSQPGRSSLGRRI